MNFFLILIYFLWIMRVSYCCLPSPQRPQEGNGSTGNGSLITTPSEESTATTTATTGAPSIEKAKTTFYIDHNNRSYHCYFEFEFEFNEGINIKDEASSECVESSTADDVAVKFLAEKEFLVKSTRSFDISCSIYVVFEEKDDQISLSEAVVLQSMKCSPTPGQCLTEDGPDYPNICTFPFIYQDRIYQACTDWKDGVRGDRLWCATQTLADKTMVSERWSWCNEFCGYCGGKDLITTNASQTTVPATVPATEMPGECKTVKGKTCKFPFIDGSNEYSECAQYQNIYHWCAVTTNSDGSYDEWDKCDPESCHLDGEGKCKTISGPDPHSNCIFPFKDGSKEYTSCAPWNYKFWCATAVSADGSYTSYGYCATDGTCPMSQTRGSLKASKSCGYDCFINLNKKMVSFTEGVSQDILLPPTSIVGDLTKPEWNVLPNGMYQFLIGQKGIDLKCPQGTTFSKFPEESQITVTCTGEYLFNVKGLATGKEWNKEENINFGCNPCPVNYQAVVGYIPTAYGVAAMSLADCEELCEKQEKCQLFQYISASKHCSLHADDKKMESVSEIGHQVCKSLKHKCAIPLISWASRSPDQESLREGETVIYKCIESTEMVGDPSNTCTRNGFAKPLPSCIVCCDSIVLKYELGGSQFDNPGYYDTYDLQTGLKNEHVWYKSKSEKFAFWKTTRSGKKVWVLGELSSEKVVAQLDANGCPYDSETVNKWEMLEGKYKQSGKHRGDFDGLMKLTGNCALKVKNNMMEIYTLPVGQGEGALIKCPNSDEHFMVDLGSSRFAHEQDKNGGLVTNLLTYLSQYTRPYNVKHIFLTHQDTDHINGVRPFLTEMRKLQADNGLNVHKINVYLGGARAKWEGGSDTAEDLIKYLYKANKIDPECLVIGPYMTPAKRHVRVVDLCLNAQNAPVAQMHILAAGMGKDGKGNGGSNNEQSLVMKLVSKAPESTITSSMLFMGDFEGYTNYDHLITGRAGYLTSTGTNLVMTVPHHGSETTAGDTIQGDAKMREFYALVKPRYAIVSSHLDSPHHHPRMITLNQVCQRQNENVNANNKNGLGWYENIDDDDVADGGDLGWGLFYGHCNPTITEIHQTSNLDGNDNNIFFLIKTTINWNVDKDINVRDIPWEKKVA